MLSQGIEWPSGAFMFPPQSEITMHYGISDEQYIGLFHFRRQIQHVKNVGFTLIAHFDGRHRSGKSLAAITIASIYDRTFWPNFEDRVVHSPEAFLKAIEDIKNNNINGGVIVVDEAGATMASTSWFEAMSQAISKSVQILGYLHIIIFFVSPIKDFLLSGLKKMTNVYIHVKRYDRQESKLFIYNVSYNAIRGKIFHRHPTVSMFGELRTLNSIRLRAIPKWIMKRYQALEKGRKSNMLDVLKEDGSIDINKKKMQQHNQTSIDEYIKQTLTRYAEFETHTSSARKRILDKYMIAEALGIPHVRAGVVKIKVEHILNNKKKVIS